MFSQLKRLAEILAGPPELAQIVVGAADPRVAQGKIWIEFDGALIIRQGCGRAFFIRP